MVSRNIDSVSMMSRFCNLRSNSMGLIRVCDLGERGKGKCKRRERGK